MFVEQRYRQNWIYLGVVTVKTRIESKQICWEKQVFFRRFGLVPLVIKLTTVVLTSPEIGNLVCTADQFQPGIFCRPALNKIVNIWCNANLLQLISHHGTFSVRDLGLLCCNKILWPAVIRVVIATRSVFLVSVISVTFGLIWPWFCTPNI